MATIDPEREALLERCKQNGISWARGQMPNFMPGPQAIVRQWLDEQEREAAAEQAAEQRRLTQAAIDAARDAADVSREAAIAARDSAKWTMAAAIIAGIGVLVTVAQGFGLLPKA